MEVQCLQFGVFQSTLPRGERLCGGALPDDRPGFNPRSRGGSDPGKWTCLPYQRVSIHAPAGGATCWVDKGFKNRLSFNPRSRFNKEKRIYVKPVAPPAGAWIETIYYLIVHEPWLVASPAGAWIETGNTAQPQTQATSLPPRERGLKPGEATSQGSWTIR